MVDMEIGTYTIPFIPLVGHANSRIPEGSRNTISDAQFYVPPGEHMLTITAFTTKNLVAEIRQGASGDAPWTTATELPSTTNLEWRKSAPKSVIAGVNGARVRLRPPTSWVEDQANDVTSLTIISFPNYIHTPGGG